ncbi:DUF389 domain-containing protein [Microcoleus sp. FACHB-1515]|uniref:DUF389 domain-containing protein n=1 Tax=Cyanophyceae TaxID=3028117 RepID=UPI001689382F|nr:DUF389 domain-containing protein [Microcoleus sp. FACHB-1515]MBD2089808.1 DUF389 domain-containing protein [Microcoleus sp. FACHB-1515]
MLGHWRDRFRNLHNLHCDPMQLEQMQADLLAESTLNAQFLILIVGSCAIATFGLLSNSAAVIIGAMIVAPLMLPIRGVAFAALSGNLRLFRKGAIALTVGTLLAIAIAYSIGRVVQFAEYGSEVLARSQPTLLDLGVAIAAGGISGYAKVEPKISGSLAGTAIAVALMPPVCVIGLGLAQMNTSLSQGATLLYLTNLLGIALACMMAFLLTGYATLHRARRALLLALGLTVVLVVPLGVSFARLVRQARLETSVERALLDRTVTFQRVELLRSQTNWQANPPEVRLSVRAQAPITPRQVGLLEAFITQEMGQPFQLVFEVGQVEEVRSTSRP